MVTGGCACGAVRYELATGTRDTGWCHCRICQRVSGSGGMVFTTIARDGFTVTAGADRVGEFRSTRFGARRFCRDCGAPLLMTVDHAPDALDIVVASLDDPEALQPAYHIFAADAPRWQPMADGLPRHDRVRPGQFDPGTTDRGP